MKDKYIKILGWVATVTAISMYVSYIPQIMNNLAGMKGDPIQPFVAAINCLLWVLYGFHNKDVPIVIANFPGVLFGSFAFMTALSF